MSSTMMEDIIYTIPIQHWCDIQSPSSHSPCCLEPCRCWDRFWKVRPPFAHAEVLSVLVGGATLGEHNPWWVKFGVVNRSTPHAGPASFFFYHSARLQVRLLIAQAPRVADQTQPCRWSMFSIPWPSICRSGQLLFKQLCLDWWHSLT